MKRLTVTLTAALLPFLLLAPAASDPGSDAAGRLVARMLGPTPAIDDLQFLCDRIGGRPTGSAACARAVDWFAERFREAGVPRVSTEMFGMPRRWEEDRSTARIVTPESTPLRIVAAPYSLPTPDGGLEAPVVHLGNGEPVDFERAGERVRGAWILLDSEVIVTLGDLFHDYIRLPPIMDHATRAGAAGMLIVGSRQHNLLYRHMPTFDGALTPWPMAILARDDGLRLARLARSGETRVTVNLGVRTGPPFQARNIVAEIPGQGDGSEIVLAGAHIDSWGLGTGALDNGANCVMLLDVARQIAALGTTPRRTVRIVLFSGEEQGLFGSLEYARAHHQELDRIAAAVVFDLGTGRITGFSLGGREELRPLVADALRPVQAYDADQHSADAFLGTDNFDFLLQGVPNLVATQAPANYMEHYHASSDTFDKVDVREMKINGAIAASLIWGLANAPERVARQEHAEIKKLIKRTGLLEQMRTFGVLEQWEAGSRGRSD
jgi:hypothetical protein